MAEDITKVSAVEAEEPKTMAEKEETVAENAGVSLEDGVYKLDLNKVNEQNQEQDAVQEQETKDGVLRGSSENEEAGQETEVELQGVREEEEIETPIIEQITDETDTTNETGVDGSTEVADPAPEQEEVLSEEKTQEPVNLPENIQNLVNFMEETGGTIEDFVSLNTDFSNVDDNTLMVEYYKKTKPHLSYDEISFLMEDKFSIDEEIDEERDVKRKKLALKEEVAKAKNFFNSQKDQYYKEVKLGSKLNPEQKKAVEFFNRYNEEQKTADELLQKQTSHFNNETSKVFNSEFKGFNFKVGDKKYRFNVGDVNKVKETQADLFNVFNKYVNKDTNLLGDAAGYHKALFAASNPDALANHFYEQGKAEAIKEMSANAKNINMDPRKTAGVIETGGTKVRVVGGLDSSKLKLKLKNY
jgi:hypothetical protein|tara:strand:- start:107 stop:1351 length:1245 start_codon:yes stop_codon:yes gene_type:complete